MLNRLVSISDVTSVGRRLLGASELVGHEGELSVEDVLHFSDIILKLVHMLVALPQQLQRHVIPRPRLLLQYTMVTDLF